MDDVVSAMKDLNEGKLSPVQISQMMEKAHALPEYTRIYRLLVGVSEAAWQAKNGDERLASFKREQQELLESMKLQSTMSAVCSQAFGQEDGKILMGCIDVGSARRVVLLVDSGVYASASYPLNGRFTVVSRGVKQYSMTNANAFNAWQSTEMVPTFEAISPDIAAESQRQLNEVKNKVIAESQKTIDALALLHDELKSYGKSRLPNDVDKKYDGYLSLVEDIKYGPNNSVDFGNMTFPRKDSAKVILKDGEFRDEESGTSYRLSESKKFDLNSDGLEDYVVTLVANYGGMMPSEDFLHYIAIREAGRMRMLDLAYIDASASEVEIEDGKVVVWPLSYGNDFSEVEGAGRDYRLHRLSRDKTTIYAWKNFQLEKSPSAAH